MKTCKICGEHVLVPDDLEHTGFCNLCAQKDALRMEWLESQRGTIRGTDFPLWSVSGDVEDGRGHDMTLREAIDKQIPK